jgi:uncharacterized protein involved in oxidation of intracellular sulfur
VLNQKGTKIMEMLLILSDPPYGSERSYNALRLADQLVLQENVNLTLFLMGDAVSCAKAGQKTPQGYFNIERMLKPIVRKGEIVLCGTCMDARGMTDEEVAEGARRGTLKELTALTIKADKVIVF